MRETKDFHRLFHDVQMNRVFSDSKTFADAIPKRSKDSIAMDYFKQLESPEFDMNLFLKDNFYIPREESKDSHSYGTTKEFCKEMWSLLKRKPHDEKDALSSKLSLSHDYIVPGGRFDEIYYWDSYFTCLGLIQSGEYDLVLSMIDNF